MNEQQQNAIETIEHKIRAALKEDPADVEEWLNRLLVDMEPLLEYEMCPLCKGKGRVLK